jgi:hypothetical protein
MNRIDLEKRAVKELIEGGYATERSIPSVKYIGGRPVSNRRDFYNCFDVIAIKDQDMRLIQVCSGTTLRAHEKKINLLFPTTTMPRQEIWYYYKVGRYWAYKIYIRDKIKGWYLLTQ